jgi:hypothetical protein
MSHELTKAILRAHKKSYQTAFETAVRTGTCLIFSENGKIIKYKPPYRYKLVPTKSARSKKS